MKSLKNIINIIFLVDIDERSRQRNVVDARRAYARILKDAGFSFQHIGDTLGKNHATVIHYVKSVDDLIRFDSIFEKKFMLAKKKFLEENEHLKITSKRDIYETAIGLENRIDDILSKTNQVYDLLKKYEEDNDKEHLQNCKDILSPLIDS
jgi:predicted transcriptional regulator